MAMDLLDTLTLFGTVALAAPIGLLGVEFLVGGRTVAGVGFLAIALALVAGGYFRPSVRSIVTGTVTDDGDETAVTEGNSDDGR
jgi:hypothetical protein